MSLSVIVHNLDVTRPLGPFRPFEADPPLVIDADAVLAFPVALERFKAVSRQIEVQERGGGIVRVRLSRKPKIIPG